MSKLQILSEFKTQITTFFDELIAQFPQEGDLSSNEIIYFNSITHRRYLK